MTNQNEAQRTAKRVVSIRYETIPPHEREVHWQHCDALAEKGIIWYDYEKDEVDAEVFRPKAVETSTPKIMCKGETLVLQSWQDGTAEQIINFLRLQGLKPRLGYEKKRSTEYQKFAGGSSNAVYVYWSDMGNETYDDGYALHFTVGEEWVSARLGGNTRSARFEISITGSSKVMDSQEVEDVVSFVTHRIDNALRPLGYADPTFNCSVDLHYSRVEACDVSWLAKSLPKDATHYEDEEE